MPEWSSQYDGMPEEPAKKPKPKPKIKKPPAPPSTGNTSIAPSDVRNSWSTQGGLGGGGGMNWGKVAR